ncbi:MAG: ergothioneine biosynthesis protein EgtB [Crocinitomicaceae bacterium]|nr:ergothioneine biosynthesis protein EgtB [Crocinitomicaceae bacterium]
MTPKDLFLTVRARTEEICAPLKIEDYVPQPVVFASPPKWHLAHTTWFFEAFILEKYLDGYSVYDKDFSFLFNSYYNTVGERTFRADRGNITRPSVEEVFAYRKYVDEAMMKLLQSGDNDFEKVLLIGLNHEQQHQELLITDLKYTLGHNPLFPVYDADTDLTNSTNEASGFVKIEEGVFEIGHHGDEFCFDNELGRHKVYIHEFEISNSLVTNGEFIEFIEAGGYSSFQYWLDEGWAWVNENGIESPLYWYKINGEWHHYTLAGLKKVDPNKVLAHISFYEASAFAFWNGMRLPTEFEWEVAADKLDWGVRWEWTNSAYLPYPNFKIASGALGEYNGKFMVNQMVLRGGSTATAEGHSRKTYRNFFHPHYQWQYTGIRLAK